MAEKNEYKGTAKLAAAFHNRIKEMNEKPPILELGTIGEDGSLVTDGFRQPIPKGEYLVCRGLTLGEEGSTFTVDSNGDQVKLPKALRGIKPGDRVLVAWMDSEAAVIDIIKRMS